MRAAPQRPAPVAPINSVQQHHQGNGRPAGRLGRGEDGHIRPVAQCGAFVRDEPETLASKAGVGFFDGAERGYTGHAISLTGAQWLFLAWRFDGSTADVDT